MQIKFNQQFKQSAGQLIRRCGYGLVRDRQAREESYARRLSNGIYPRFHLYINSTNPLVLNLHLDQKQASYEGQTAHSGDYDSDLVKQEAQRLYYQIVQADQSAQAELAEEDDKKGFWGRLFGK
jgi:hypothetical protein